ncbi:MAG: hypothetical protein GY851_34715 [bacterium]|nr:hypothetical protein [bacterium]
MKEVARISRRRFFTTGAAATAALTGCGGPKEPESQPPEQQPAAQPDAPQRPKPEGRVIILGFDGVEPSIVETMLEAGELPNLAKLRDQGAYSRLGSTIPPQSPVAWTTFATCKNPGGHGIFDFIRRRTRDYFPQIGTGSSDHPRFAPDGAVTKPAAGEAYRKGRSFWSVADEQGIRCKILNVPFVYPPEVLKHGKMLSGLGVPDIRCTDSTFFSLSDAYEKQESAAGGVRLPLKFDGDVATAMVPGARDPRKKSSREPGAYVETPVKVTADRAGKRLKIEAAGATLDLAEGAWSEWVRYAFEITPKFTVHAISRFFVAEVGEQVRLYMACLQFDPKDPYIPYSEPKSYSAELADKYGLKKTIGWAFDTHALRQDALTEDGFLQDVERTMAWREQLTLDELDRDDFDLIISAWTATDRVGHMFWRFRDKEHAMYDAALAEKYGRALEGTYEKMDEVVGKVSQRLKEGDLLIILSDHGFGTYRIGFNVNTWLVRNGYAVLEGQTDPETAVGAKGWLFDFDWAKSRAYAIGLSSMYVNVQGREGKGIVPPGEADALIAELKEKLLAVTHPETGDKVFDAIYTRADFSGEAIDAAPDIVFGYAKGYQNTKSTAKGSVPADLFETCKDKWSGEHAASDMASTPGILFANRALTKDSPAIQDLGVTTLAFFGIEPPSDYEGAAIT